MGAADSDSTKPSLVTTISLGVLLLEQIFLYFSDENSRFKILILMNLTALVATVLLMAMTSQLGSPQRRRFPIFYAAVLGGFIAFTLISGRNSDYFLIDNPSSDSVEIIYDGKPLGVLPANNYAELPVVLGVHHIVATNSNGTKLEDTDFTLRRPGLIAHVRAIYNLGGAAEYAAVTFDYANQNSPRIVPETRQTNSHLVLVHHSFDGEKATLDQSFDFSIQVKRGDSTRRTHLCHYVPPDIHGCADRASKAHKFVWANQSPAR